MSDQIDLLERAAHAANHVVSGVKADQLGDPTPCREWTVRNLLNHMVGTAEVFASAVAGEKANINPFGTPPDDVIGDDPQARYADASTRMVTAWRKRGLDGTVTLVRGEMPAPAACTIAMCDHLAHGWDLAQATGQQLQIDDEVIEAAWEFTQANMGPAGRGPGKPFAEAVEVSPDAPRLAQLMAFMGRTP